ncbi:MAG: phytoene/squalene synthase family protein [Xanthobacteraceae bacterium]|jgi:15-cis-phytoene synthase
MQDAFAHCEALVRAADKDRFLATLFAPAEHRHGLFALYAFNIEVSRVREVVREPLSGEIRLQWWSEVVGGEGRGEVAANPVAAALTAAMTRYALPRERLATLLEARRFDLYDEPMTTLAALDSYAEGTASNLIALAAQILNGGRDAGIGALAHHAGLAYAIAGLLKALPTHAARGQLYVPVELLQRHGAGRTTPGGKATPELRAALAELRLIARRHLAKARELVAAAPPAVIPALLVLAPAAATLTRMERRDYEPFVPVETAQWRRQWLIWRAARRSARMFG